MITGLYLMLVIALSMVAIFIFMFGFFLIKECEWLGKLCGCLIIVAIFAGLGTLMDREIANKQTRCLAHQIGSAA